jgi:hypothetical protein
MMLIGAFFLVMGGRYPTVSFMLFTTLAIGNILLFSLFAYLLPAEYMPLWTVGLFAPVCFIMGGGLGYGAAKWPKIGIAVIAFSVGGTFGQIMHSTFTTSSGLDQTTHFVEWAIIIASGALAAVICIFLFDYAVIIGSGMCGAYLFIRVSNHISKE